MWGASENGIWDMFLFWPSFLGAVYHNIPRAPSPTPVLSSILRKRPARLEDIVQSTGDLLAFSINSYPEISFVMTETWSYFLGKSQLFWMLLLWAYLIWVYLRFERLLVFLFFTYPMKWSNKNCHSHFFFIRLAFYKTNWFVCGQIIKK